MPGEHERVVPFDIGVRWDPNGSDPLLIQEDRQAALIVGPHFDDLGKGLVVIRVDGCDGVWLGPPNDEGVSGHRLWNQGLNGCLWAGEVHYSRWIEELERVASVHHRYTPGARADLRHWILLFKEKTAEVLGTRLSYSFADPSLWVPPSAFRDLS